MTDKIKQFEDEIKDSFKEKDLFSADELFREVYHKLGLEIPIHAGFAGGYILKDGKYEYLDQKEYDKELVNRLPHWIIDRKFGNDVMSGEKMVICSECHKGIFWGMQPYCPNCGAKMANYQEEEDDE